MHPILAQRNRLASYLASWLIVAGLLAVMLQPSGLPLKVIALFLLPITIVYSFICLASWYHCRTMPLETTPFIRIVAITLADSIVTSSVWLLIIFGWAAFLQLGAGTPGLIDEFKRQYRLFFVVGVIMNSLGWMLHYLIITFESAREVERHSMALRYQAQEAELRMLRAQINPHFLFNSLNSISALTTQNPGRAREMTLLLADFFRTVSKVSALRSIPLSQELGLLRNYLEIEQVRFGSRLQFDISCDDISNQASIPPLLLQPLVENAVKHGIANVVSGGIIAVRCEKSNFGIRILVENPVDPEVLVAKGNQLGLSNVRKRLATVYGNDSTLDVARKENIFRVEITLPLEPGRS